MVFYRYLVTTNRSQDFKIRVLLGFARSVLPQSWLPLYVKPLISLLQDLEKILQEIVRHNNVQTTLSQWLAHNQVQTKVLDSTDSP